MNRLYVKPTFVERRLPVIREELKSFDRDDLESYNLDTLIYELKKIKEGNPKWEVYKLELNEHDDSWSYFSSISIIGEKEESLEEYELRKKNYETALEIWNKQVKEDAKLQEKKEKDLYLKLKQKFEK